MEYLKDDDFALITMPSDIEFPDGFNNTKMASGNTNESCALKDEDAWIARW